MLSVVPMFLGWVCLRRWTLGAGVLAMGLAACAVYDDSLLLPSDGGGGSSTGGQGGEGNAPSCTVAEECPGEDTPCQSRICDAGVCGAHNVADGTELAEQMTGDCVILACDGQGDTRGLPDDDPLVDGNECTTDACAGDAPVNEPSAAGTSCSAGVCDGAGACVECVDVSQCGGDICQSNVCIPATCIDGQQSGNETDLDCGGSNCFACEIGQGCGLASDCVAGSCPAGTCVCGGDHLMISELRSRGQTGGNDEFIELYNPTPSSVLLDASWTIEARGTGAGSYGVRWTGNGDSVAPNGHYLVVRSVANGYDELPAGDDSLSAGFTDAAAIRLVQSGLTVDAVCYAHSASTLAAVQGAGFECEGEPADNLPHNNSTAGASNSNVSLQRRPGGALGNCMDTGNSLVDFISTSPGLPQGSASAPTP